MPNRHSSGRGAGSARHAAIVSGRFLSGLERPSGEHHVLAARHIRARAEHVEVDARRDQLGVEPELAQAIAFQPEIVM